MAHRLADLSGVAILKHFREVIRVDNKPGKGVFDPVTLADREAETVIREALTVAWPDHGIIGEEFGTTNEGADYCWVIDPIDGTRAFIMGYPDWGTLIGLMHKGEPVLGVMNQPFTSERFWSQAGVSSYLGQDGIQVLKTRDCTLLENALLSTTSPDFFEPGFELDSFMALKGQVQMCRYGGDCYAYSMLAAGHIDLVVEAGLNIYDIMPLIPIIEGAGGVVTDWTGGSATQGGRVLAAGTEALHAQALKVLASQA